MKDDTPHKPTITCQDTNDPEQWAARLSAADQALCLSLVVEMFDLWGRLETKGIQPIGAKARAIEGMGIYSARFGVEFVPYREQP